MKKRTILYITLLLIASTSLLMIAPSCHTQESLDKMRLIDSVLLTNSVVIDSDTFDITQTHWIESSVTLSNGVKYDYGYIEHKFTDPNVKLKIDSINNN